MKNETNKLKTNDLDSTDNDNHFSIDYWKCPCGKLNSNHSEICVKCGKERPLITTIQKIFY